MPTTPPGEAPNRYTTRCWVCGDPDKPVKINRAVYRATGEPVPNYEPLLLCDYHREHAGDDEMRYEAIERPRLHL